MDPWKEAVKQELERRLAWREEYEDQPLLAVVALMNAAQEQQHRQDLHSNG